MYFIPTEAYQHWPMAWLGIHVLFSGATAFGVENVA